MKGQGIYETKLHGFLKNINGGILKIYIVNVDLPCAIETVFVCHHLVKMDFPC